MAEQFADERGLKERLKDAGSEKDQHRQTHMAGALAKFTYK